MSELAFERAFREWAEATGVGWERLHYPRPVAGGHTVAYRLAPPGAPRAVAVVAHGAGNDALFALVGLFKELLRRGFEVFTFDLDGHGRHSSTRFAPEAVPDAVLQAVAQSRAGERGLPLHTVGVSLGGAVLLHTLPRLTGSVASSVLISAPLHIEISWRAIRAELGRRVLRTVWRERTHYGVLGLIPSFGPFRRGIYPLRLSETPPPGPFGYVTVLNAALERMHLESAARRVDTPTLLVYGTADQLTPVHQGERLAALLPHCELLRLEGETHLSTPLAPPALGHTVRWLEAHTPAHQAVRS